MVRFHTGYPLDENNYHDEKLLCEQFNLPLPADYAPLLKEKEVHDQRDRDLLKNY
jgi:lincosamide nucleotidyltransferase A/C/D/E